MATAGAATRAPKRVSSRYSGRGSVTPSRRRSAVVLSRRLGTSLTVSPTRDDLRIRRSVAGRCWPTLCLRAESGSSPPAQAVPSQTRTPSGVSIQAGARRTPVARISTSPTKARTGSPSVVAFRKCRDRPPRWRQSSPNRASSRGGNCSKWMFPATVPPRKPRVWAVASSWMDPAASRERLTGRRRGPANTPSRASKEKGSVAMLASLDRRSRADFIDQRYNRCRAPVHEPQPFGR